MKQAELDMPFAPPVDTVKRSDGWEFQLTEGEIDVLRRPITETSGGWQGAMREAAMRVYPGGKWRVSDDLMTRLFRMCARQGKHGGYQRRLPMRVLSPVFCTMQEHASGTWLYGRIEEGDHSRIKIGKTDNLKRRTGPHSTDNPRRLVRVFRVWDASGTYENQVKARFAHLRLNGEWYAYTSDLKAFVAMCQRVQSTAELPQI